MDSPKPNLYRYKDEEYRTQRETGVETRGTRTEVSILWCLV